MLKMKIRRIQYNIDYVHILTFREEYKNAVIPYFGFDNLRYGIDNENTTNESIRLIFNTEAIAISFRKDGITIVFDGESKDLKNQNGVIKLFWDLYERVKKLQGYRKTTKHSLICVGVFIMKEDGVKNILKNPKYFSTNPFGPLNEFCCVYEFEKDEKYYKFDFGNYSEKDIKKHDLQPFKAEFNKDLIEGFGLMCRTEIQEKSSTASFSKFKSLLTETEKLISSYRL